MSLRRAWPRVPDFEEATQHQKWTGQAEYGVPPISTRARDRIRVEEIVLRESPWARYAEWGARYSDLFAAALEEQGTLCIGIYRLLEEEEDAEDQVSM